MKKIAKILLILAILAAIDRFCHRETASFQRYKIESSLPNDPRWDTPAEPGLDEILGQPFSFIGNGNECYAFLSRDGKTVLKLFKQQLLRPAYFRMAWERSGSSFYTRLQEARKERLERSFISCKIAHDLFKEESGLIYLHLNHTDHLDKTLTFTDKLGIAHTIDLDRTKFVLQKRAELVYARLGRLIEENDLEKAKQHIDTLLKIIADRCEKGIADRDPRIVANFGFIGEQAVEIDLGSYSEDPFLKRPQHAKKELFYISRELKEWLKPRSPELAAYVDARF